MTSPRSAPRLLIVIGANGAGKTTWTRDHRDGLPKPFYNADSIAEGLGDPNSTKLQAAARGIVDDAIDSDLRAHRSFGFESTYSGTSRPAVVRRAKALGYVVEAVFIGTSHHDINISRVQQRVQQGGHDVPTAEITRRWNAAQDNLRKTLDCFNTITILDNSAHEPTLVAIQHHGYRLLADHAPAWTRQLLEAALRPGHEIT